MTELGANLPKYSSQKTKLRGTNLSSTWLSEATL